MVDIICLNRKIDSIVAACAITAFRETLKSSMPKESGMLMYINLLPDSDSAPNISVLLCKSAALAKNATAKLDTINFHAYNKYCVEGRKYT